MQIKNKDDLISFVNIIKSNNKINDTKTLKKIRDKTEELILSKGDIFPNSFLELFENFQNVFIESDEQIDKHINFFNNYYNKASLEEKFILNNLLFGLEILNGNAKKGLEHFIKRTFEFNIQKNINNSYIEFNAHFILNLKTKDKLLIKIVKEIINPEYFFKKDTFTRRAYFVNILSIIWNNPIMTNNKIWLEIFDDLINLLQKCVEFNFIEEHMYIHFFTYHIYGNNIQTIDKWRKFNKLIETPASKFYQTYSKTNNLPKPKKRISTRKKKLGFILDRIVFNSPYMVMYSLWKNLMKNTEFTTNYEIYIYSLNYVDKQFEDQKLINELINLGIKVYSPQDKFINYFYYYPHLKKALDIRNKIIEDKIDYLITSTSGYDINNFLITNRSAPKQIFWSHGNCAFDIPNIDKRISHFPQECKEFNWEIFNVPMEEEFLIGPEEAKEKAKILKEALLKQFGKETIFLGTIGRLIKLESEEYLKVLAEIMEQNPNTIYLACGSGNQKKVEKLMKKQGIDLKRVVFTGQVDPHMFGWVIDVWINTYPLPQGISQEEYHAKGNGIVIQSELIIKCKEKNDYERIKDEFLKNRKDLFCNVFEIDEKNLKKDISLEMITLNIYKKYNKNIDEQELLKCIKNINHPKNCKEKWLKRIEYICKSKEYRKMQTWIVYRLWKKEKESIQRQRNFLNILKGA